MKRVQAGVLEIAYLESGDPRGWPVLLMHGFPYDVRAYDRVAPILVDAGARVTVPWLRGYGQTRFVSPETPRSGEQAALGADLLALMDALEIPRAHLAGYDWGGRACCIVAALWPERVAGLVILAFSAAANQLRLFLHAGAYWMMWTLRAALPKRSPWRRAQFDTLRLRLVKIAAPRRRTEDSHRRHRARARPRPSCAWRWSACRG